MKLSNRLIAIIALIIANVIWGAANPIFKWSLQDIPPFTLAFFRFFIASLLLWPFVVPHIAIRIKDIPKIVLLSFVGIVLNISFFFLGLRLTSSIDAPIIGSAAPIMLILFSIFYLKEKPKKRVLIGTIISFLGIMFIIIRPLLENGHDGTILGNLLILLATLAFVIYTVLLKKFDLPYKPLALIFWIFFVGSLMFLPMLAFDPQTPNLLLSLNVRSIVGILFGAFSSSTLAYLCYSLGVQYLSANEVGIFFYLDPIATVLFAIPLLGEQITIPYIVGSLVVFLGIFVAEGKLQYHHPHHLLSKRDN